MTGITRRITVMFVYAATSALLLLLPAAAAAVQRPAFASDYPAWKGYGQISSEGRSSCIWRGCLRGTISGPVTAWRWSTGWQASQRRDGERVYVHPYASGWSWTWTATSGWLAVASDNVVLTG